MDADVHMVEATSVGFCDRMQGCVNKVVRFL